MPDSDLLGVSSKNDPLFEIRMILFGDSQKFILIKLALKIEFPT